ncbi:MAG: nuclear transport factor 2 family protein [Anaerolineae bacterium]|nr:nuclear transport factor 2 family protein [Anaerolineae bacterium]
MNTDFFINLEKKLWQALLSYDLAAFGALLADDVMLVATDGARRTKAAYLQRLPQFTFGPCAQSNFAVVQLTPDAATVNYIAEISGTSNGKEITLKLSISSTWVQRQSNWQIVFTQDAVL